MNPTKLISNVFSARLKEIGRYAAGAEEMQTRVLRRLLRDAAGTEWGERHGYRGIRGYDAFREQVPVQTYDDIKPYVERMRAGETNLLWPSRIR